MNKKLSTESERKSWLYRALYRAFDYASLLGVGVTFITGIYCVVDLSIKGQQAREARQAEVQRRDGLDRVPPETIIRETITTDYAGIILPRTITTKKTFAQAANCQPLDFGRLHTATIGGENGKGWKEVAVLCP